jgi:hypothetical protein
MTSSPAFIQFVLRSEYLLKFFGVVFFCFSLRATAQVSSPYSRLGLGHLRTNGFSANRGFAELSGGYASTANINFQNPASYSSISFATLEIGANMDIVSITTRDSSYNTFNGSFSHVAVGVPLKRGIWGMSFGLLPFSNMNYTFRQMGYDSSFGGYQSIYRGFGSLYQAYMGSGVNFKGFSFGVNAGYLFGKLEYTKFLIFPDSIGAFNSRHVSNYRLNGFVYNAGIQYRYVIKKKTQENNLRHDVIFSVGIFGNSQMPVSTKLTRFWDRFIYNNNGIPLPIDTVSAVSNFRSGITLPFQIGGGLTLGNEAFWLIGADFRFANWKSFSNDFNRENLNDSWRLAVGMQYTPNIESRSTIGKIQWKLGAYYGQSEVTFSGKKVNEAGCTIGLGWPLTRKTIARINMAADIGRRGFDSQRVMAETYYRLNLGFVLNDTWFIRRKFD